MTEESKPRNAVGRLWAYLRHPSPKYSILTIWAAALALGIAFWGAFNWSAEPSNKM